MPETFYDVLRRQGVSRRSFMKFCSLTAAALGLGPEIAPQMAYALKPNRACPYFGFTGLNAPAARSPLSVRLTRSRPTWFFP